MTQSPDKPGFAPLPRPDTSDGRARLCGVEIEFSGLTETETAQQIKDLLGGRIEAVAAYEIQLHDTELGRIKIELDTALTRHADKPLAKQALDAARPVIPVEIVTEPLGRDGLLRLDALRGALRRAGAKGSGDGVLKGFGVHLNPEIVSAEDPHTPRTILAYALVEDHLRATGPIDPSRRLLPFVDPWPRALVDALVSAGPQASLADQRALYATHATGRNYGLDLLPLFKAMDPEGYARDFPDQSEIKARPAFHFRLPDSRVDDPGWRLAQEWRRWHLVETVAADPARVDALCAAWTRHREAILSGRRDWAETATELVTRAEAPA